MPIASVRIPIRRSVGSHPTTTSPAGCAPPGSAAWPTSGSPARTATGASSDPRSSECPFLYAMIASWMTGVPGRKRISRVPVARRRPDAHRGGWLPSAKRNIRSRALCAGENCLLTVRSSSTPAGPSSSASAGRISPPRASSASGAATFTCSCPEWSGCGNPPRTYLRAEQKRGRCHLRADPRRQGRRMVSAPGRAGAAAAPERYLTRSVKVSAGEVNVSAAYGGHACVHRPPACVPAGRNPMSLPLLVAGAPEVIARAGVTSAGA
jgi:hypothetical protein